MTNDGEILREDLLVGKLVEDLLRALRRVPRAREAEHASGADASGRRVRRIASAQRARARACASSRSVYSWARRKRRERRVDPFPEKAPAQRRQRVEHPGESRVAPEEDQPASPVVHDLLVVDERAAELHEAAQHRHVRRLALGHVREEEVGRPGSSRSTGISLTPMTSGARREIVDDARARRAERLVGKDAERRDRSTTTGTPWRRQLGDVLGGHGALRSQRFLSSRRIADHRGMLAAALNATEDRRCSPRTAPRRPRRSRRRESRRDDPSPVRRRREMGRGLRRPRPGCLAEARRRPPGARRQAGHDGRRSRRRDRLLQRPSREGGRRQRSACSRSTSSRSSWIT